MHDLNKLRLFTSNINADWPNARVEKMRYHHSMASEPFSYQIKTSKKSSRKYPNVIWFPRSKTDPREIREVLKTAFIVQRQSKNQTFSDKTLGETMASGGSINVLGLDGKKYIEAYKGKSIGDVSYITNARMLMRLFRFLGFVTRVSKGNYRLTSLGELYTKFSGEFPAYYQGNSEEAILLNSLGSFTFYSTNDDPTYRDKTFKLRPFIWLLYSLSLEPQCIYQLIVTAFASKNESSSEATRILTLLNNLRNGKSDLAYEWKKVGLNPDDYSCVHNFYDSVKILVYLGSSLGLIAKTSNPVYGRKIAGKARNLKQANTFYILTEKGVDCLKNYLKNKPVYYDELYNSFGEKNILSAAFILASLNTTFGNKRIICVSNSFIKLTTSVNPSELINFFKKIGIEIKTSSLGLSLLTPLTFNFWQSIPPEIFYLDEFLRMYELFMHELTNDKSKMIKSEVSKYHKHDNVKKIVSSFILNTEKEAFYEIPFINESELDSYISYQGKENIRGGTDRFPARISPTNSVFIVDGKIHVDNDRDALDLLVPLRHPDKKLKEFIHNNFQALIENFIKKTDNWEKDQHYTWVRNCFRLFGADAIFSGSGGMLSRADVSVSYPFIGGIEIKSPRENRGTLNTKSIRQAVDAKIQVADQYKHQSTPRAAIAIGRRISSLAIKEEKKWASENQPVLLLYDVILYYLSLKTADMKFPPKFLATFFSKNRGLVTREALLKFLIATLKYNKLGKDEYQRVLDEVEILSPYLVSQ